MRKQTKLVVGLSAAALLVVGASLTAFAAKAGWVQEGDDWYYMDSNGDYVTNTWKKSGANWYYLGDDGFMVKNQLVEDDNNKYYFVDVNGAMVHDQWQQVEAEDDDDTDEEYRWYYFGSTGRAYYQSGSSISKKTINGKKYAFDDEGRMLFGYVQDDGTMINDNDDPILECDYYFGTADDGAMKTGWLEYTDGVDDTDYEDKGVLWIWFKNNGKKQTGTKSIKGKKYYFDAKGIMASEWSVSASGATINTANIRYFGSEDDGSRKNKNWIWAIPDEDFCNFYGISDYDDDEYRWFYTNGQGILYTDCTKKINGKWYAFDQYGRMKTGFVVLDKDTVSGAHFVSQWAVDKYSADEIYTRVEGSGNYMYFFSTSSSDGSMKTGTHTIELADDEYKVAFKKTSGRMLNGIDSNKLYRCGILQDADDEKYAVKKYVDNGTDKYYVVNASGTIVKKGKTGKNDSDMYYAVKDTVSDGTDDNFALFSGDDASKVAKAYATGKTIAEIQAEYPTSGSGKTYDWQQETITFN
jgi:glucan-binding YG repeat protein